MMTSVTLPSSSGPSIHGGFTPGVANESTDSEEHIFEPPRPSVKRCLTTTSTSTPLTDASKKRRKQSTPVRISASDSPPAFSNILVEGKHPSIPSPEETSPALHCPLCQVALESPDQLQTHLSTEHVNIECKKEPLEIDERQQSEDSEESLTNKHELPPWMHGELPNKEWLAPNLLSFPGANHMFMGLPPPFAPQTDALPPRQPIRIFNPDAYCELCNKEFCNKYFLKTHKANKHGIYTDPPPPTSVSGENSGSNPMPSVNIPSFVANVKLPTSIPPNVDLSTSIKIEKTYPDLVTHPFATKLFNKVDTSEPAATITMNGNENPGLETPLPSAEESSSPPGIIRVQQNETTSTSLKNEFTASDQEFFYASPSKLSPGQQSRELDLSNRYRRIGVMNPKAFCEICCKEYCNKYFLRTHKMKRHGIYIPDDRADAKDMKMELGMSYMQTSPLNLIMGEQSNSSDRKTSSPSDIKCDSCGIKFQNASLFQLHNINVHAKLPTSMHDMSQHTSMREDKKDGEKADSISEDLQKLQTMILQLNDLEVKSNNVCSTCGKDFENRYYLHAHMMTEHGLLLDDNPELEKSEPDATVNNNTMCDMCGKDFPNSDDLKKHMYEVHKPTPTEVKSEELNNGFSTPEKSTRSGPGPGSVGERRSSMNLTPTSSYCEICNKELCNKYFMKTHMQRMHGIEIENGAQIGGVICDICNKELCSKYFLRVHKHNTHGIVEYGSNLLQPSRKFEEPPPVLPPVEADPALKPADLADLSHRYFTHFTEVCTLCSRRFRSTKWLKAHLLSDHGQIGAEKWAELEQQLQLTMGQPKSSTPSKSASPTIKVPISSEPQQKVGLQNVLSTIFGADESTVKTYHCSYCSFSTPVLPFLFVHERSHMMTSSLDGGSSSEPPSNLQLKCPVCMQTFPQPEQLQHHVFSQHPFLPLPPFFNGYNENSGDQSKEPSECAEDNEEDDQKSQPSSTGTANKTSKKQVVSAKRMKPSPARGDMPPEMDDTLKDVAKKAQLPATYALPQPLSGNAAEDETPAPPAYVMQAFRVEEQTSASEEQKVAPAIVFLPVLQKLSAPVTATFTLTPA